VISANPDMVDEIRKAATLRGVTAIVIGEVTGDRKLKLANRILIATDIAREAYRSAIPKAVGE
jgi:selenophosphate synthetase-related protein